MLMNTFEQKLQQKNWWQPGDKLLIAVSGGVDSISLLHMLLELPEEYKPDIYVAHVNHQLREESAEEEAFVLRLCRDKGVPIFTTKWAEGLTVSGNIEQKARSFRYNFFDEVMKRHKITHLLTAHHEDDQVETIMMRWINGSRLRSLVGMKEVRRFGSGELIRPLLSINKNELISYANKNNIIYYEDESNHSSAYLRNRLRNHLIPEMKQENPKFNEHVIRFKEELEMGYSLIAEVIKPKYDACVHYSGNMWEINRQKFISYTQKEQYFILECLMTSFVEKENIVIGFKQKEQLYTNILSNKPNQEYHLKENWYVERNYEKIVISKIKKHEQRLLSFNVALNEGVFLSETEWFGFFEANKEVIPSRIGEWDKNEMLFNGVGCNQVVIRKRKVGDRLLLNRKGQTKKVSRYFIDEKIPAFERQKTWVVEEQENIVKWLVPFRESYLSIRDETAKIQYKLVYFSKKDK